MASAPEQTTSNITLYTSQTPNGIKISMALEELGLPYKVVPIDLTKNTQKEPWFLSINPNGRIPALTDTLPNGTPINLFESGSILLYLTDRYDPSNHLSYPRSSPLYYEMTNWLFFQNAGLGPMQGQAHHFRRYAPEKIPYAITRYQNETRRLYGVLEGQLEMNGSGYLVGGHISIADVSAVGWVWSAGWAGLDIDEFPHLKRWEEMLEGREAIRKGRDVPSGFRGKILVKDEEENEKRARAAREWILRGMKEEEEKQKEGKQKEEKEKEKEEKEKV